MIKHQAPEMRIKDPQVAAIYNCLEQIIMSLAYQPDIPQQHKVDMVNSLGKVAEAYYKKPEPFCGDEGPEVDSHRRLLVRLR
jgi:hypothetical protein